VTTRRDASLDNPLAKVERAQHHLIALDAATGELCELARSERMQDGAVIARVKLAPVGPDPQVQMDAQVQVDIAFGAGPIRAVALGKIGELVRRIIDSFASDFEHTPVG
jgi:hypothetical protein